MTNYFEIFARDLSEIKQNQEQILARLGMGSNVAAADEIGGIDLATQVTRLSKDRIYALVSKRAIPHKKRGNRLHFNRAELLAWVEQGNRQQKGGAPA